MPTIILRPGEASAKDIQLQDVSSGITATLTVAYLYPLTGTATDVTLRDPTETPVSGSSHSLTATGVDTGAPSVGAPAITQAHALNATNIDTGAPSVGSPAITQVHSLTATGVATLAPSVGSPAIAQEHALAATGVATSTPSVGAPSLFETYALTATGISTAAPSVGSPSITSGPLVATQTDSLTIRISPRAAMASMPNWSGGVLLLDRTPTVSLALRSCDAGDYAPSSEFVTIRLATRAAMCSMPNRGDGRLLLDRDAIASLLHRTADLMIESRAVQTGVE